MRQRHGYGDLHDNAIVWKNGVAQRYEANATITEIVVSPAGDLYAADYITTYTASGVTAVAAVWKNGVRTDLDSGGLEANATGICISAGKVYVSGIGLQATGVKNALKALLWIDGEPFELEDAPRTTASAYSVAIME